MTASRYLINLILNYFQFTLKNAFSAILFAPRFTMDMYRYVTNPFLVSPSGIIFFNIQQNAVCPGQIFFFVPLELKEMYSHFILLDIHKTEIHANSFINVLFS